MGGVAVNLLWLLIGVIIFVAVVLYGIKIFTTPGPERLEQGIWFIFLLLIVICASIAFMGGWFHVLALSRCADQIVSGAAVGVLSWPA